MFVLCGCQGANSDISPSRPQDIPSPRIESLSPHPLDPPYTLAFLPLDNLTPNARLHWLGRSLSEMLANDLAIWPSLSVVAREAMGPVLREQWLQQRGFSSSVPPVELGHLQGVHYLVRGGFHQYKENLKVDLQIVDVETGVIVGSLSAQGPQSEIPRVEHDLVVQLLGFFQSPQDSTVSVVSSQVEEKGGQNGSPGQRKDKDGSQLKSQDSFSDQSVHQLDIQLSLERMTQYRMDAFGAAETFWQKGWSAEMGQPRYHVWQASGKLQKSLPLLTFPISLFIQQNNMADVLKAVGGGALPAFITLEPDGFSRGQTQDEGISQLFFEHLRQSRRLFVRALNEQGELMAVYSKWGWQTTGILQDALPGRIAFPMWPKPFISGIAEFPVAWIERNEQHVTFDLVILPIPNEYLSVILEPINERRAGEQKDSMKPSKDATLLLHLKSWIKKNWKPPITESLPVEGHLPHNKLIVDGFLNLQAGKIVDIHFPNISRDTLFFRSLEDLKASLLESGLDGPHLNPYSTTSTLQKLRLQLTLVKDLQALQFGSRSD